MSNSGHEMVMIDAQGMWEIALDAEFFAAVEANPDAPEEFKQFKNLVRIADTHGARLLVTARESVDTGELALTITLGNADAGDHTMPLYESIGLTTELCNALDLFGTQTILGKTVEVYKLGSYGEKGVTFVTFEHNKAGVDALEVDRLSAIIGIGEDGLVCGSYDRKKHELFSERLAVSAETLGHLRYEWDRRWSSPVKKKGIKKN